MGKVGKSKVSVHGAGEPEFRNPLATKLVSLVLPGQPWQNTAWPAVPDDLNDGGSGVVDDANDTTLHHSPASALGAPTGFAGISQNSTNVPMPVRWTPELFGAW